VSKAARFRLKWYVANLCRKMFAKLLDFNDPFYKPLWLRILIVAITAGWSVFEFFGGTPFWGVIFLGAAAFAFHGLFIAFNPRELEQKVDNGQGNP
jgi:hypothetical protein